MSYRQLVDMHRRLRDKGFQVLAFPSNDFHQERGSDRDIVQVARGKYGAEFPIFEKVHVNGKGESPVYSLLKRHIPGEVPHNFYKYLVGKDGVPVKR